MTIDEAYRFCQFVTNKSQQGNVTPAQFNMLAPIMQMSVINDRLGNVKKYQPGAPVPPYGFNMNDKTREELRPISVPPTVTPVTAGVATMPAGLLYLDTITVGGRLATEATDDEIALLNVSATKPPTVQYPKYVRHANGLMMYPTSITSMNMSYIITPTTPFWNYTVVNDEPVYNPSGSQDFELNPLTHFEICALILSPLGINLGLGELTAMAEAWQQQGK